MKKFFVNEFRIYRSLNRNDAYAIQTEKFLFFSNWLASKRALRDEIIFFLNEIIKVILKISLVNYSVYNDKAKLIPIKNFDVVNFRN